MKQVVQNMRTGETSIVEVPVPAPRAGTALVQTRHSLVSAGTERMLVEFAEKSLFGKARSRPDLVRQVLDKARREGLLATIDAAFNRLDQPLVLGYSSSGVIAELGDGLAGFGVGQRVACAGGGYAVHAEYGVVPANLLVPLPEAVDFESAAFTTLGAIALHGFRLANAQIGERVAVIGLGLLGLLAASIIRAAGCHTLGIDLDPQRVKLAQKMGFYAALREKAEEASQEFTRGRGFDAVLICADTPSSDPVELAGELARDRASVVAVGAVGLTLPRKVYYEKELNFVNSRSYGPGRYDPVYEEKGGDYPIGYVRWTEGRNLEAFVELLASGQVDVRPLVTHRYSIESAPQAYELITGKTKEPFLGVLLTYGDVKIQVDERVEATPMLREPVSTDIIKPDAPDRVATIKLGVLGAGNFAQAVLFPALKKAKDIELVGVASASGISAQHAAKKFGFAYASTTEEQILADSKINTIAILTRHNLHAQQVVAALQAGKHVFCEKPLALNQEQLDEIESALPVASTGASANPLLMVGFNRRFSSLARALAEFLSARAEPLVAHYRVNAGHLPANHWLHNPELGGGRIIGEGCHFIDFLTFLVGAPPVTVSAHGLPDQGRYREDNVVLTYTFPDGSLGTLSYLANGDRSFGKEYIEVYTGGRVAVLDDFRSLEMVHEGRRRVIRTRLRQDKGHQAEWAAFSATIRQGSAPPIPYVDLFGVARASFASVKALRTRQRVEIQVG